MANLEQQVIDACARATPCVKFSAPDSDLAEDGVLVVLDDGVYVGRGPVERRIRTLVKDETKTVDGFYVYEVVVTPATRWEPEDADIVKLSEHLSLLDAIKAGVNRALEWRLDNAAQYVYECSTYAEEEY